MGAAGGMPASPSFRPQHLPCFMLYMVLRICTSVNISRALFANYWRKLPPVYEISYCQLHVHNSVLLSYYFVVSSLRRILRAGLSCGQTGIGDYSSVPSLSFSLKPTYINGTKLRLVGLPKDVQMNSGQNPGLTRGFPPNKMT